MRHKVKTADLYSKRSLVKYKLDPSETTAQIWHQFIETSGDKPPDRGLIQNLQIPNTNPITVVFGTKSCPM